MNRLGLSLGVLSLGGIISLNGWTLEFTTDSKEFKERFNASRNPSSQTSTPSQTSCPPSEQSLFASISCGSEKTTTDNSGNTITIKKTCPSSSSSPPVIHHY